MPSSDFNHIPKVLQIVTMLQPHSILDVGCGNGRYGMLFREFLDWNYGRLKKDQWEHQIYGIDTEKAYFNDIQIHHYIYDYDYVDNWLDIEPVCLQQIADVDYFDLIFMGDVLEHFREGEWQLALDKARGLSKYTLVVSPNWPGSTAQGAWHGHESEVHRVALSPEKVGGRCLFANSKSFMCVFDNFNTGAFDRKDCCL